jgi:predicted DNA-binding protein (UPF0251 family)
MPRPCCLRHVGQTPRAQYFKPAGIPIRLLKEVVLGLDELEALRLADLDGLYQEQAAELMKISRPTFSRIVEHARRKVADVLMHGKALRIATGPAIGLPAVRQDQSASMRQTTGRCGGRKHGK